MSGLSTAINHLLEKTGKAADADLLDGKNGVDYLLKAGATYKADVGHHGVIFGATSDGSIVAGGWARCTRWLGGLLGTASFEVGAYGGGDSIVYGYLTANGVADGIISSFDHADALRIYPTYAAWGGDRLFHAGNHGQILQVTNTALSGTLGVATVASTWNTFPLNTVETDGIAGATLAANQISLPAGTYQITGFGQYAFPFGGVQKSKLRLRNVTDNTTVIVGAGFQAPTYGGSGLTSSPNIPISGRFTLFATKVLELQIWTDVGGQGTMGAAVSSGEAELFADLIFERIS